MEPCDALRLYCAGRHIITSRAVTCSLQQEAVNAVEQLTNMRCITVLWKQWSRWAKAKPESFWKAISYDAVMRSLLDTIGEKLDAGRRHGRVKHVVFASYAQLLVRLAMPNDKAAFEVAVETLVIATGHGRKCRRRIGPTVHLAMEHFVTDWETYMGKEAVILLLRTITAFEVTDRIRWTPFVIRQLLRGGASLQTLLKVQHQRHTRAVLLSCVTLAEHMPEDIGMTAAELMGRVSMAGELWNELVLHFNGDALYYPPGGRHNAWTYTPDVLGEDVANSLDIDLLIRSRRACVAGNVLLRVMPTESLVHVANRLCEADVVEEFLLNHFENIVVVQYLVILCERSPELRGAIVAKYDAHSDQASMWIRELLGYKD